MQIQEPWSLHSRIHPLKSFPKNCYVKREDELSCAISGTKLRKYSSLVPYLLAHHIEHLVIIAGPQSNNLLAAVQIARELQLKITAFLLKPWSPLDWGNYQFTRLFLKESDIIWVERSNWIEVDKLATSFQNQRQENTFVLAEGAAVPQCLPGAMTLGEDIIRNEGVNKIQFNHIFIEAGTGFSAAALSESLSRQNHPAKIHVLLLADTEEQFYTKLQGWLERTPENIHCFYPTTAKAFGSVNQTIRKSMQDLAYHEGFLVEPLYSAKLFYEAAQKIRQENSSGNHLIIHSGGLLSLAGQLQNYPVLPEENR